MIGVHALLLPFRFGLLEPLGAFLRGALPLAASDEAIGLALSFATGVMTYIATNDILPSAHERGDEYAVSIGLLLGIVFMMTLHNFLRA